MKRSVGDLLMWLGAAVGAGGGVLLAMGAWVHLPQALIIAIAKALPFVVAVALLAIGAVVRRSALRAGPAHPPVLGTGDAARLAARDAAGAIGEGAPRAADLRPRTSAVERAAP